MSALAARLAKETGISALTNEEPSMAINLHTLLEEVRPFAQSEKKGALVSFVMKTIRVDPETRIDRLLKFRRARADQFAELSAQFDEISSKISDCESVRELRKEARVAYRKRIQPKLAALREELQDNAIQSAWEGFYRAVTIAVPATSALAYFGDLSGTALLGVGAALTVTDVAVRSHLALKKAHRSSPYTYLLDVKKRFAVP